mmetsp:Transcript_155884/g.499786  ORF Transcript_155884/g.499786 Transcript_155884/m.499786 type:complete len:83 (-) Transcript_155884:1917-2165(-)
MGKVRLRASLAVSQVVVELRMRLGNKVNLMVGVRLRLVDLGVVNPRMGLADLARAMEGGPRAAVMELGLNLRTALQKRTRPL